MADVEIPLRARDGSVRAVAYVDAEDAWVLQFTWSLDDSGYAKRNRSRKESGPRKAYLHREVMGCVPGDGREVDHRDFDRLNCRRSNLRVGTPAQNRRNRRGNKGTRRGVTYSAERRKWIAQASVGPRGAARHHTIGYYDDEEEAATAVAEFWEARDAA